ncbi:MAG: hypothetical protein JO086_03545 [Acidimicrobiia bacterium]|nr:hypothetical protein [Acidimicrobiia bacterium]
MGALLDLAVAAPLAGAVVAVLVPDRALDAVRASALVAGLCWLALLLDASVVSVTRLHSAPIVAAAGLGAALLVAAVDTDAVDRPALLAVALTAASIAVAAGRTATDGGGAIVALAAAAALASAAGRMAARVWATAAAGLVVAAIGVVALRSAANAWQLPLADATSHRGAGVLVLVGAALVVVACCQRARAPLTLAAPAAAFVAAQAAPMVHRSGGLTWFAVVLAIAATAASVAARAGRPLLDRPAVSLALLGFAALVVPGAARGPGLLLVSGGLIALALDATGAAALGVPGGIGLGIALAARGGGAAFVVGALGGLVALALAAAVVRTRPVPRPSIWMAPVLGVGVWLLVGPGTWGWVGPAPLHAYDAGAARAVAGGALCLLALVLLGRDPAGWYARVLPPDTPGEDAVRH